MNLLLILTIKSKNKKSHFIMYDCLNNFFIFQKKTILENSKISKITLLKSPHIHKKAQQHFEQRLHKTAIVFLINSPVILILLKKLIDNIFLDNYINYKYVCNNILTSYAFFFWFFNLKTYFYILERLFVILRLIIFKKIDISRLKIFTNYLKIINLLGKSCIMS